MKIFYLSSEIHYVASSIINDIKKYKKNFKTAFIITGSELKGNPEWVEEDRTGMKKAGFDVFDYTITGKTITDFKKDLADVDIVHVNGGDPYRIVTEARKSGFDKWLNKSLENGIIYTGSSGGSMATAPDISGTNRDESEYPMGLNLTPILVIPHWGRPDRHDLYLKERFPQIINEKHKLILLNDAQYVKVEDGKLEIIDVRID